MKVWVRLRMGKSQVLMIVAMLIVGVLGAAVVPKAKAATVNLHLYGNATVGWGFSPGTMSHPGPLIEVHDGDLVNLTLTSQDGLPHQFFVDYNGNGLPNPPAEPESPQFTGTIVYSFTANTVGNVTYYCAIHPSIMNGPFHVLPGIPEFPALLFLPIFMMLTLLAVVLLKRPSFPKHAKQNM
jgi:plastocyanin